MNRETAPILRHEVKLASLRLTKAQLIPTLIFHALLVAASGPVFSQVRSVDIPENASAKRYGTGWECDRGYRETDGACVAVDVSANAYPTDTSYGRGWECSRGYRQTHKSCVAIKPPPNAYLYSTRGDTCKCKRGCRPLADECFIINVPQNEYLTTAACGPGWKCTRGYRARNEACVATVVPGDGYLTDAPSGSGGKCDPGYLRTQGSLRRLTSA